MNDSLLMEEASSISENTIERFLRYEEKIKTSTKFFSLRHLKIAAVACIGIFLLSGIAALILPLFDSAPNNNDSYFTLKAYAENGELQELNLNEGYFNSGYEPSGTNQFGVDQPLFQFRIDLTDSTSKKISIFDVNISVFYDGREADPTNDKHIRVSYFIPLQGYDAPYGFGISGWFEEPTDITIAITDEETGKMLANYTVNVCYLNEREGYILTVTEKK